MDSYKFRNKTIVSNKLEHKEILIMIKKKTSGRPTIRPTEAELNKLYQKHTAQEIANMYNTKLCTVRAWIKHYRDLEKAKQE